MTFITIGSITARLIADDNADHEVTAILDQSLGPWLIKAAVPGAKAILTTPRESIEVTIVSANLEQGTVTFTIGDQS